MTPEKLQNLNEEKLFNYLKDNHISDLSGTSQYSYTDCSSAKYKVVIELKCRKTHYPTLLIEEHKYNELMKHPKCRYICSTPKGIYSFSLHHLPKPEFFIQYMPATSEFENNNLVPKSVAYLNISDAKNILEII